MSMDFNFWKYKEGAVRDNKRVYESACCDSNIMEELESLPIEEILNKITFVFSDWEALDETHYENEKEGKGSFEILIDFGCPLYDPQIETRFDEWTDR